MSVFPRVVGAVALVALVACAARTAAGTPASSASSASSARTLTLDVPGWPDRAVDLAVPRDWDGTRPLPLILALHGGGGDRAAALRSTCPGGDLASPGRLDAVATAAGYAVARPDGSVGPLRLRTWNAGGGRDTWQCTSGRACARGVDDLAYLDAVRAVVQARVPAESWFATGLSNGGAMSYRLACARADVFRGIAPIGAGNQAAAHPGCAPSRPVALLHIHGSADPCWSYAGGTDACAQRDGLRKVGAVQSLRGGDGVTGWATHLGCAGTVRETALPDTADDGMRSVERRWEGCAAPLVELFVEGGGHTVPDGFRYLRRAGPVTRDFSGSARIVAFFDEVRGQ